MPKSKKIREMTDKEFRAYVSDKKVLLEGDPAERLLNADYAGMDADEQIDFILYSMKIKYVGLKDLSLDEMREMLDNNIYDVKDIWNDVRIYMNADDIRRYSHQLALTLFGDYMLDEQSKFGKEVTLGMIQEDDINDAFIVVEDYLNKAKAKEYINPVQISAFEPKPIQVSQAADNTDKQKNAGKPAKKTGNEAKTNKKTAAKKKPAKIDEDGFEEDWIEEKEEDFIKTFAYEVVTDKKTGLVKHNGVPQPIGNALTEDIINTGNLKMLKSFRYPRGKGGVKLSEREKEYLDYKISTAEELDKIERKALHDMAWDEKDEDKVRNTPKLDVKNGYMGFSHLKLPNTQTSNHGCWSCAYSLLLKSRGVDLSQEKIRAFRPDYKKNTPQENKASKDVGLRLNSDVVNNIFETGDLLHKVLPNTAMNQLTLNSMEDAPMLSTDKGLVQMNDEQRRIFKDYYINHTTEQLRKVITDALTKDRSPVAINWNNHYVTITGIKADGTIRVEDSARSKKSKTTGTLSLKEVVEESLYGRNTVDGFVKATGLSLVWLKDIKPVEYSKRAEETPELYPRGKEYVKVDTDGNVKVDVPLAVTKFSGIGESKNGQVNGTGISESLELDQTEVEKLLGGKVENFGDGQFFTGNMETYFPKKVRYLHDPSLNRYAFYQLEDNTVYLHRIMQASLDNLTRAGLQPEDPGFDRYINAVKKLALEGVSTLKEADKKQVFQEGIEILNELRDYFRRKAPDGRTYYQLLEGGFEETDTRERFRTLWLKLDRMLNLNIDVKDLQSETEAMWRFNNGLEAIDTMPKNHNLRSIYLDWDQLGQLTGGRSKKEYQMYLARILARELLYEEAIENMKPGDNEEPFIDYDTVVGETEKIIQSRAFQVLMSKGHYKTLAKSRDTVGLVNEYMDVKRKLGVMAQDNLNDYTFTEEEYKNKTARIGKIWDELSRMGTGSYDRFGIISRSENSAKYEYALEELKKIKNDEYESRGTNGADNYMSVEVIKDYLEGKEKVRGSAMGKKRWNLFMTALSEIMPRKEFEEYCDHINRVRGVENKPDSKDYVGPELFYDKNVKLGTVLDDTVINRINSGKATKRDYARLLALRSIGLYIENGQEKFRLERSDVSRTTLLKETDKILRDTDFAAFMELVDSDTLKNMMQESVYGAGLAKYKTYLEEKQTELEQVLNVYENAHPLSTQFILDHVMVKTGAAIRALWDYSNADDIPESAYESIHKYMAQHVLQSIMETEASEPEEAKRTMTNKLTGHKELIEPSVTRIMESDEFKEALKTMKLDRPDPVKIKVFLLGQKGDLLAAEFNKQIQKNANRKKEIFVDKDVVKKSIDKTIGSIKA